MVHEYPQIHGYPQVHEAEWLAGGFSKPLWTSVLAGGFVKPLRTSPDLRPHVPPLENLRILDPWSLDSPELAIDHFSLQSLAASNP